MSVRFSVHTEAALTLSIAFLARTGGGPKGHGGEDGLTAETGSAVGRPCAERGRGGEHGDGFALKLGMDSDWARRPASGLCAGGAASPPEGGLSSDELALRCRPVSLGSAVLASGGPLAQATVSA